MSKDLRYYEQVLCLRPECSDGEQKEVCRIVKDLVKQDKGKLYRVDTWGSRPIANPRAKKATRGYYFYLVFSALPSTVQEIRNKLSISKFVLYFHEELLPKKQTPEAHIEDYLNQIKNTKEQEEERILKIQKKKQAKFAGVAPKS